MGTYVSQVSGSTSDAGGMIQSQWSNLNGKADQAFSAAMSIANSYYNPNPITIGAPAVPVLDTTAATISTAGAPTAPLVPSLGVSIPSAPVLSGASYTVGVAPTFSGSAPSVNYPTRPNPVAPATPGAAPSISAVTLPDDPNVFLPSVPALRELSLPETPTILMPTFSAVNPSADLPELVQPNFIWEEAPYTERLPQLASKIAHYLAFDFDAAETAIWERGQERTDRATNEAVLNLTNDFASRGFSLPTGSMLAAVNEARMKGAEARYDNARDAMIKAAELNTQKLTVALQTGIQYESMWMNYQSEYAKRAFEAAKIMIDVTLKLFDAKVALFNARLQAYQTEAQVHRDLIQAELARLEVFKTELEGQKLIGEMNMQDVEIYKAQLQGALATIEVYKAQVSAVVATIEVDKARLQGFESQVNAYKAQVDANSAEYASWGEAMRGEAVKAQLYETEVRAFAARVDAYKATESVGVEAAKLQIMSDENLVRAFSAELAGVESTIKAFAAEVDGQSKIFDSQVKSYTAVIGAREAEARMSLSGDQLKLEAYKTEASISIEQARTQVAMLSEDIKAFVGRIQASGQIVSQLAASAMSAFNIGASTSESFQLSVGNSLNENHNLST